MLAPLILLFITITIVPSIAFTFLLRWYLQRKFPPVKTTLIAIVLTAWAILAYLVYTAFYPANDFYVEEFERGTHSSFPVSGEIIAKNATYPDIHGDYTACAVVRFSRADYDKLLRTLRTDTLLYVQEKPIYTGPDIIEPLEKNVKIILRDKKQQYFILEFMNDLRSVYMIRVSS